MWLVPSPMMFSLNELGNYRTLPSEYADMISSCIDSYLAGFVS